MGMMGVMRVTDFRVDGFPSNSLNLVYDEAVVRRWEEDVQTKAMAIKPEKKAMAIKTEKMTSATSSSSSSSTSSLSSLDLLADVATQQSMELLLDEKTVVEELINFFARKGREPRVLADKQGFELNDIFIPKKKRSRLGPLSLKMKTLKRKRECSADPNSSESGTRKKKKEEVVHVQTGCTMIAKASNWSFRVSDVSQLRFVLVKLNSTTTKEEPHQHLGSTSSGTSALTHQ